MTVMEYAFQNGAMATVIDFANPYPYRASLWVDFGGQRVNSAHYNIGRGGVRPVRGQDPPFWHDDHSVVIFTDKGWASGALNEFLENVAAMKIEHERENPRGEPMRNPGDEELRRLERLARTGDVSAQAAYDAARGRVGQIARGDVVAISGREYLVLNVGDNGIVRASPLLPTEAEVRRQGHLIRTEHYRPSGGVLAFDVGAVRVQFVRRPTSWETRSSRPPRGRSWIRPGDPYSAQHMGTRELNVPFTNFDEAVQFVDRVIAETRTRGGWTPNLWLTETVVDLATCGEPGCLAVAERGGRCQLHGEIRRCAKRCEARRCRPSCTRGLCWRRRQNPGDEGRRRLERLAAQGDVEAQAQLDATRARIGKDPPWVRWQWCATAALTGVLDQPELWRAVRAAQDGPRSPIVTSSQRMDARSLLRQAAQCRVDVVFLRQPHDWAPGPFVLAFYDGGGTAGAVWATPCGEDTFATWRDRHIDESDAVRSFTMVEGYVNRPELWRELHPLGSRHYWR